MRRIATFLLAGSSLFSLCSVQNARAADAVAVEPAYVTPGKPITLKWYFTGDKVLLSGGRFGKGVVVTGKTSMTDTPRATTKYTFDVWYKVPAPKPAAPKGVDPKAVDPKAADAKAIDPKAVAPKPAEPQPVDPKAAAPKPVEPKAPDAKAADPKTVDAKTADPKAADPKAPAQKNAEPQPVDPKAADPKPAEPKVPSAAPQEMVMQHVQYTTYAEVWSGVYPPMKAYRDSHGWQVSCLSDWKRDNVPTAEEGTNGLNYFQPEDDSIERLAVAVMPVKDKTVDDVLKTISDDVDAHYQHAVLTEPVTLTVDSLPAKMITFTGLDMSHPGTKTTSMVLLFVRNGKAYVLSARTGATHFGSRRPVLEKLLKSFAFNK